MAYLEALLARLAAAADRGGDLAVQLPRATALSAPAAPMATGAAAESPVAAAAATDAAAGGSAAAEALLSQLELARRAAWQPGSLVAAAGAGNGAVWRWNAGAGSGPVWQTDAGTGRGWATEPGEAGFAAAWQGPAAGQTLSMGEISRFFERDARRYG